MRNLLLLPLGLALLALPSVSSAVNYGTKNGTDVMYIDVSEDSITDPVPLFGNPTTSGNALVFTPVNFGATSTNGGLDITDSTLTTIIMAKPGKAILKININEAGDYTLAGSGTSATSATVTAPYFFRIIEVNNLPLVAPLQVNGNLNFSPSGGTYDLVNDPGAGVTWTGNASVNIAGALAAANIQGIATKVLMSMDNQLIATSQTGTTSFIKKKTADGVTITVILPEPATLGLIGGGLVTLLRRRR